MCFTIPYRVLEVKGGKATVEGGKKVDIRGDFKVKRGDYLQISGNLAVGKITPSQGLAIRKLIKNIYDGK